MTTSIKDKLEQRGYWRVEIHPTDYKERRFESRKQLQAAVEKARVELRGWDFPHIERNWDLPQSQKWIGIDVDWHVHVEMWRAFLSGQFVYRGGVWVDWLDQDMFGRPHPKWSPRSTLPIVGSIWTLLEFIEFAARWSQTEGGGDQMAVNISFHGLEGRLLYGDHERRAWFHDYGPAKVNDFTFERVVARTELLANAKAQAAVAAQELFDLFGYEAEAGIIASIQDELLSKKGT